MMNETIFSKILDSNKYVVDNMKHIKINTEALVTFAKSIKIGPRKFWILQLPFGISELEIGEIITLLLIYHSMGFSFWADNKWETEYNSIKYDGSVGLICALMKERNNNSNFFDFNYLSKLKYEEFRRILKGKFEIPLLINRYNNLNEVCNVVCEKMKGYFYNYIKEINNDVELFELIINSFNCFNDISTYQGEKIYYYKLAQILTSDILHAKQEIQGVDICLENLIGGADYKVPQVLRDLNIIEYDNELAYLVDNKIEIPKDSEYENEIRSTMLVVIDLIKKTSKYNSIEINDYIWLQGQDKTKIKRPYHRTRTTLY